MDEKILLVGLGGFGKHHVRVWNDLGLLDRLKVVDLDPQALDKYNAGRNNFPGVSFPELKPEQFSTDISGVFNEATVLDIVTPADAHYDLCIEGLEKDKAILVEKPMTLTSDQALKLDGKVREKSGRLQVGFHYRYNDLTTKANEMINSGELGDIRYFKGEFKGFKRPRTDVGVTHSDGIHFVDLLMYLTGTDPIRIQSTMASYLARSRAGYPEPFTFDDFSISTMKFRTEAGDVPAVIEAGYIQPGEKADPYVPGAMTTKKLEIGGSKATLVIDYEGKSAILYDASHTRDNPSSPWKFQNNGSRNLDIVVRDPLRNEFEAFLDCLKTGKTPLASSHESVRTQLAIEAIYRAAQR